MIGFFFLRSVAVFFTSDAFWEALAAAYHPVDHQPLAPFFPHSLARGPSVSSRINLVVVRRLPVKGSARDLQSRLNCARRLSDVTGVLPTLERERETKSFGWLSLSSLSNQRWSDGDFRRFWRSGAGRCRWTRGAFGHLFDSFSFSSFYGFSLRPLTDFRLNMNEERRRDVGVESSRRILCESAPPYRARHLTKRQSTSMAGHGVKLTESLKILKRDICQHRVGRRRKFQTRFFFRQSSFLIQQPCECPGRSSTFSCPSMVWWPTIMTNNYDRIGIKLVGFHTLSWRFFFFCMFTVRRSSRAEAWRTRTSRGTASASRAPTATNRWPGSGSRPKTISLTAPNVSESFSPSAARPAPSPSPVRGSQCVSFGFHCLICGSTQRPSCQAGRCGRGCQINR